MKKACYKRIFNSDIYCQVDKKSEKPIIVSDADVCGNLNIRKIMN
ncbi:MULTISPECIES: hypothetical protein [Staphylococcus]|uniref:Uncharacterized protein n=1 Tax=Staphylococcus hsinchuensis TaxID=3051183 RepID=A0ABZ3EAC3_9STAP